MTLEQFIAEIESSFSTFVDSNSINRNTIKLIVVNELKRFGLDVCELQEKILHVENSTVRLPETFKSLRLALKLDGVGADYQGEINQTDEYIFREYIKNPAYFDRVTQEYVRTCNPEIITEKITVNNQPATRFYKYQFLSLVKGIKKEGLATDCLNLHPSIRNSYPHEISITNQMLQANFSEGDIYIQFYSLPTDEDGEIIIPETTVGDLFRYIENQVKVKIAEDLIANNQNAQGLAQLYPTWKQQEMPYRRAALVETKFMGLGKNWAKKFKAKNRQQISVFNLPI